MLKKLHNIKNKILYLLPNTSRSFGIHKEPARHSCWVSSLQKATSESLISPSYMIPASSMTVLAFCDVVRNTDGASAAITPSWYSSRRPPKTYLIAAPFLFFSVIVCFSLICGNEFGYEKDKYDIRGSGRRCRFGFLQRCPEREEPEQPDNI